jgi:hypothetical protein
VSELLGNSATVGKTENVCVKEAGGIEHRRSELG